ncbi:hypothetical protein PshuTeo2_47050 [Pseudomonas hunanensis]|uniref:hypothetical protein n=1 Tax=Pseudomonas TaxID=286 RepID=UPI00236436D4|nr:MULTISPECIES: hypothetical protein [Pseudomonas]EKT4457600.1 hypothetical protein [Pseudomonas putida]EKT4514496.1 hypothetical protein [Pseudomonas putida]MDD2013365.1 hypothetical protein [Pseudomonas putida]MDF3173409.1 hypothetical protein [Pseudomonas sp. ER28]MDH1930329.1 hypothetical protein [Pseudomonas sp. GD03696]
MRIGSLDDLKCKIQQDGFFEDVVSSVNDWNEALDRRDDDVFDSVWSDAFEELKNLEYSSESDEKAVNEIREYVFKKIYGLVLNPDAAGYISDDIGLVAESISKLCSIEWVEKLFDIYCAGEFPN